MPSIQRQTAYPSGISDVGGARKSGGLESSLVGVRTWGVRGASRHFFSTLPSRTSHNCERNKHGNKLEYNCGRENREVSGAILRSGKLRFEYALQPPGKRL